MRMVFPFRAFRGGHIADIAIAPDTILLCIAFGKGEFDTVLTGMGKVLQGVGTRGTYQLHFVICEKRRTVG
jgi:hypothetical protein